MPHHGIQRRVLAKHRSSNLIESPQQSGGDRSTHSETRPARHPGFAVSLRDLAVGREGQRGGYHDVGYIPPELEGSSVREL